MARSAEAADRQKERAERRRDQILDAAEVCFRAEGFHGASMSRLAAAAEMSVGHIYQYFESKEAIIIALCERNFEGFELLIPSGGPEPADAAVALVEAWTRQFSWWIEPSRAPLTLEIMSEAGRNPDVAQVVGKLDERFRDIMRRSLSPLLGHMPPEEIEARLEAVTMLAHGMTSRVVADPKADPARIMAAFRLAFRQLLCG